MGPGNVLIANTDPQPGYKVSFPSICCSVANFVLTSFDTKVNFVKFVNMAIKRKRRDTCLAMRSKYLKGKLPGKQHAGGIGKSKTDNISTTKAKYLRLPRGLYNQASKAEDESGGVPRLYDEEGNLIDVRLLRSVPEVPIKESCQSDENSEKDSYRILNLKKTEDLWNTAIEGHRSHSSHCRGRLEWNMKEETKWGMCWRESLTCHNCKYVSPVFNLFQEVKTSKRGRKAGSLNRSVQVGMAHSMISNSVMREILLALNIPAPSPSSMQRQANAVATVLEALNKKDMNERLGYLVHLSHIVTGQNICNPIACEGDARYNNYLSSGVGKTPYQPATQAVYTFSENVTPAKRIVGLVTKNKLCRRAEYLQSHGKQVTCPKHDGHCSANLQPTDSIGDEKSWATEGFTDMFTNHRSLSIKYFTSDGDSRAFAGLEETQKDFSSLKPEHLRDTRHLTQSVRLRVKKAKFSGKMFPGPTKADYDKQQRHFASEIGRRCSAEFQACFDKSKGDVAKMQDALRNISHTLILCYQGDCSDCLTNSFVCGSNKQFPYKKTYVDLQFQIYPTKEDETILQSCISIRLGPEAIRSTRLNTNTQKSEAIHRTYSKCNPKTVTMSRNFPGRIHSAAHLVNSGIAKSTIDKCSAVGAPLKKGTRVVRQLLKNQERNDYRRKKGKSVKYRTRRNEVRRQRYRDYFHQEEAVHYAKDLLDEKDHAYSAPLPTGKTPSSCGEQQKWGRR